MDIGAFEAPANLVVTNTLNSGAGSLRDAIDGSKLRSGLRRDHLRHSGDGHQLHERSLHDHSDERRIDNRGKHGALTSTARARTVSISGNNASQVFIIAGANVVIRDLRATNGRSVGGGGAISATSTSSLTIQNSIVSNSTAVFNGGGIFFNGELNIFNSSIVGNTASLSGGGMFCNGISVKIVNSTISGNTATGNSVPVGGIVFNISSSLIINSTITGNTASTSAIAAAGGLRLNGRPAPLIRNTIIAGNTGSSPDIEANVNSLGNNLIGNTSGANISGDTASNITNVNALLAPLGFYGGSTQTHALLSGSPAINAGNNCVTNLSCLSNNPPFALTTDQRGASRVGAVDIGAFEANNAANGGYRAVLPNGFQNSAYAVALTGNRGSFNYTLTNGTLPNGIGVTPNPPVGGAVFLSGTPTESGTFNFGVTVSDGANSYQIDYSLTIIDNCRRRSFCPRTRRIRSPRRSRSRRPSAKMSSGLNSPTSMSRTARRESDGKRQHLYIHGHTGGDWQCDDQPCGRRGAGRRRQWQRGIESVGQILQQLADAHRHENR